VSAAEFYWFNIARSFYCIMVTTGAAYIGEFLKKNHTLTVLHVDNNLISDLGISHLMNGLKCNIVLTELYVTKCGLSAKGTQLNCNERYV